MIAKLAQIGVPVQADHLRPIVHGGKIALRNAIDKKPCLVPVKINFCRFRRNVRKIEPTIDLTEQERTGLLMKPLDHARKIPFKKLFNRTQDRSDIRSALRQYDRIRQAMYVRADREPILLPIAFRSDRGRRSPQCGAALPGAIC